MKNIFLLVILFSISLFGQKVSPKLHFDNNTFDFHDVKQDEIIKHDFILKNIGTSNLIIKDVKSSCECMATMPLKNSISPGDSTIITLVFDAKAKIGYQTQHAYIFSNDPQRLEYRITIKANIILDKKTKEHLPKIKLPFNVYDFGNVKEGKNLTLKFNIENLGKDTLKIKKIKSGCKCITISMKNKEIKFKNPEKVKVILSTKGLQGKQSHTIIIKSNDPRTRIAILTIFANIE